jgi:uncharacterized membrane protein
MDASHRFEQTLGFSTTGSALLAALLLVLLTGCGHGDPRPDAGSPDAGAPDAGVPDAGSPDAGGSGNGEPDAGSPDAGSPDAGTPGPALFYDVTDLGALGGGYTGEAFAINNADQVVGELGNRGFLWDADGGVRGVGAPCSPSRATAINDHGVVAGYGTCPGAQGDRAFTWADGQLTILQIPDGGTYSRAQGINIHGQVAGTADCTTCGNMGYTNAFLWSDGAVRPLLSSSFAAWSGKGWGINAHGQVAASRGYTSSSIGVDAFLCGAQCESLGRVPTQAIIFGPEEYAYAVNDVGQVTGTSMLRRDGVQIWRAVVWENKQPRVLGTGVGYAINSAGHVVGTSTENYMETGIAVLWRDGQQFNLNHHIDPASGWVLVRARGIDDHGHIVGAGMRGGQTHAVLLTPRKSR